MQVRHNAAAARWSGHHKSLACGAGTAYSPLCSVSARQARPGAEREAIPGAGVGLRAGGAGDVRAADIKHRPGAGQALQLDIVDRGDRLGVEERDRQRVERRQDRQHGDGEGEDGIEPERP